MKLWKVQIRSTHKDARDIVKEYQFVSKNFPELAVATSAYISSRKFATLEVISVTESGDVVTS